MAFSSPQAGEHCNYLFRAIPADSGMAVISFSSPRRWRGELLHIIGVFLAAGKGALCGEPYLFYISGALFAVISRLTFPARCPAVGGVRGNNLFLRTSR